MGRIMSTCASCWRNRPTPWQFLYTGPQQHRGTLTTTHYCTPCRYRIGPGARGPHYHWECEWG